MAKKQKKQKRESYDGKQAEAIRAYGKSVAWASNLKKLSPDKWERMLSFDPDIKTSIDLYLKYIENLHHKVSQISYHFKPRELRQILVDLELYEDNNMVMRAFDSSVFRVVNDYLSLGYQMIQKWEKLIAHIEANYDLDEEVA